MSRRLVLLAAFVVMTGARADAGTRSLMLGDLVIRYDEALFALSSRPPRPWLHTVDAARPTPVFFRCAAAARCFDDPVLIVSALPIPGPDDASEFSPGELAAVLDHNTRPLWATLGPRDFGGLSLYGTVTHSGCRARTPPMYRAAGEHGDLRYVFATGWAYGCSGTEGFSLEGFERFLDGIALAPPPTDP